VIWVLFFINLFFGTINIKIGVAKGKGVNLISGAFSYAVAAFAAFVIYVQIGSS
jgi:hypothetical protein